MPNHPLGRGKVGYQLGRLTAASDGVIAIAITILVLGLEVPSVHDVSPSELTSYLAEAVHPAMGYVLSFFLIGTFWLEHYAIFHYLTHATRQLTVFNGIFLLCLTFLPFPTGLQAAYRHDELAMVIYSASLFLCGISILALWLYAIRGRRLIDAATPTVVLNSMTKRLCIAPIICVVAIGFSFLSIGFSKFILLSIPFFYLSHKVVDSALPSISAGDE